MDGTNTVPLLNNFIIIRLSLKRRSKNASGNASGNASRNALGNVSGNASRNASGDASRIALGYLVVIASSVFLMKPRLCMILL